MGVDNIRSSFYLSDSSNEKNGIWDKIKRNKWRIAGGAVLATGMFLTAKYAGGFNNPGMGYAIYETGATENTYSLISNPILHPGLVLTQGAEIIKNSAAELTNMARDSANWHISYDIAVSYLIMFGDKIARSVYNAAKR